MLVNSGSYICIYLSISGSYRDHNLQYSNICSSSKPLPRGVPSLIKVKQYILSLHCWQWPISQTICDTYNFQRYNFLDTTSWFSRPCIDCTLHYYQTVLQLLPSLAHVSLQRAWCKADMRLCSHATWKYFAYDSGYDFLPISNNIYVQLVAAVDRRFAYESVYMKNLTGARIFRCWDIFFSVMHVLFALDNHK